MSEDQAGEAIGQTSHWWRNRLTYLIALSIVIALFLVSVALALYTSSGAAQLDLSRPGYESVRSQASEGDSFVAFPAVGAIDKETISIFRVNFTEQAKNVTSVDAFDGGSISDSALGID